MSNLTISDINSAIMHQNWSNEQLNCMAMAIKYAREQLTKRTVWNLELGANVKFVHNRTGRVHVGTVTKINRKKVVVREGRIDWTVPANMLEAA